MHTSLKNKITLVTGVSSGIGREIAQLLAERGARVFGTVRNVRSASSIRGVELVSMDVTEDASVNAAVQSIVQKAGPIQFLVDNAGYSFMGALEETSVAEARQQFETNLDVYADERKRLTDAAQQNIERGDDPRMVAEAVWNALTARSPRLRYPVGKGVALSRMRRFVPAGMFDKSFRKQFQLDRRPLMAIGLLAGWLTVALMAGGCSKPAVKDSRLQSPRVEVFKAEPAGSNSRTFTGIVEA